MDQYQNNKTKKREKRRKEQSREEKRREGNLLTLQRNGVLDELRNLLGALIQLVHYV